MSSLTRQEFLQLRVQAAGPGALYAACSTIDTVGEKSALGAGQRRQMRRVPVHVP
ncbi:MAG: hypothetical protein IJU37_05870 [Desulfovibrio sp.]|nr:hypothetical protein [Desulfovibrio sp.]